MKKCLLVFKYGNLRQNTIVINNLGPVGCPSITKEFVLEKENEALISFYKNLIRDHKVIGSLIYHSCGDIICYLDHMEDSNPWNSAYGAKETSYNKKVAKTYGNETGYKKVEPTTYTTMDAKIKSILPGTLLIELGGIRSTPLSQFIEGDNIGYTKTILQNRKALAPTFETMREQYDIFTTGR